MSVSLVKLLGIIENFFEYGVIGLDVKC